MYIYGRGTRIILPLQNNLRFMKQKKMKITEADYLKANRRASRQEEIESHGHPVQGRAMIHKSKKVYDRNRMKRAAIKSDDSSHFYDNWKVLISSE